MACRWVITVAIDQFGPARWFLGLLMRVLTEILVTRWLE
jgi:hypothetical protein